MANPMAATAVIVTLADFFMADFFMADCFMDSVNPISA
jgi:hypothetical protein